MLNNLQDNIGSRKSSKRVGRGIGSGKGKTSAKGHKGQKARSGVSIKGFEGGQMPIYRRLPKIGFKSRRTKPDAININKLIKSKHLKDQKLIDKAFLFEKGFIASVNNIVKIIGVCNTEINFEFSVDSYSQGAKDSIVKCGGKLS